MTLKGLAILISSPFYHHNLNSISLNNFFLSIYRTKQLSEYKSVSTHCIVKKYMKLDFFLLFHLVICLNPEVSGDEIEILEMNFVRFDLRSSVIDCLTVIKVILIEIYEKFLPTLKCQLDSSGFSWYFWNL